MLHQKVSLAVPACGFARYGQLKTVNKSPSGCEKVEGHKVLSSQDFLRQLTKSETEIHEIEQKTITQSDCALWYEERKIRLTASNFHSVAMRRTSSNPEVLAERLLVGLTKKTKAMKFGLEKEQSAAERYIEKMKKDGKNVTVKNCGFRISKSHPFLGASADRLASDEEGGLVLVEIKNPLSTWTCSIKEATKKLPCLKMDENNLPLLNRRHSYYTQVQGQMAIYGIDQCDFVLCTEKDIFVEHILFEKDFWLEKILPKLENFYHEHMLPKLLYLKNNM